MINLVELTSEDDEQMQAPCKYGNIVIGHACYCHHESPDAPRKCPIWRNGEDWNKNNCEFYEDFDEQALKEKNNV